MRRITLDRLVSSPGEISRLRDLLAGGGVAAVPTETFYGLAADPRNERAVERIVRIKGRDEGSPLPVIVSGEAQLRGLGIALPPEALARWVALWPAPLTVVLPIPRPIAASRGAISLGVRVPAAAQLRRVLDEIGPVTATSANRSGEAPCDNPDDVEALFAGELDLLVDGGRTPGGKPSTVVDATGASPRVVRAGAFDWPPASSGGVERDRQLC